MDHPLPAPDSLVRPWRLAAYVASTIAAVELLVLLVIGGGALLGAVSSSLQLAAEERAFASAAPAKEQAKAAKRPATKPAVAKLPRTKTIVMVLNGNGQTGAAAAAASRVKGRGYKVGKVGNASNTSYPRSLVMYRPGFAGEATRFARDLRLKSVGPLDGMRTKALGRAHVVLILGG